MALLAATTGVRAEQGQTPDVKIAVEKLFDRPAIVPANVLLNLSIDLSTVGAAYRTDSLATYNRTLEYQGYFNPRKCYGYSTQGGYFQIAADVVTLALHECNGAAFSGNFMNWATMSTLDLLRYGLTGGDRILPESQTETILQRAVLPGNFLANPTYFPARTITTSDGANSSAPNKVTTFNLAGITLVSCENKIIIAEKSIPILKCSAPTQNAKGAKVTAGQVGEFLARVKVCDAGEGPARPELCEKYGANYKPVGRLQRMADGARVGLMAYLPDADWNRYGGVLRAPLKFLGPMKYDAPDYTAASNDRAEWDAATGILYPNPDDPAARSSTSAKSGLINYLNQFGRDGSYKSYDPVSELYYEGLRYLQGRQPTPDAILNLTDKLKEGFPVIGTWSDPVVAACQRNQIALIANAYSNYDFYVPGNEVTDQLDPARPVDAAVANQTPALDAVLWTRKLGELEAGTNGKATNPAPNPNLADLSKKLTGNLKYGSYYVGGLSFWANTHDIRLDKRIRVKTTVIDFDVGGNGNVDNAKRDPDPPRESQLYLAAKYGAFDDVSGEDTPNPFVRLGIDGTTRVSGSTLAWDADQDGVPDNYFLASQPGMLVKALRALAPAAGAYSSMTLAAPAISSRRLVPSDSFLFQAGFRAPAWFGSLKKLRIKGTGDGSAAYALEIASAPEWEAGDILTGSANRPANPLPAARKIYTAKRDAGNALKMIDFTWAALGSNDQALLNKSPLDGSTDSFGARRVDYLRGVRADELGNAGGFMRSRVSLLGDIVNSNVVYVGAPDASVAGSGYSQFLERYKARPAMLYVGANDGMLHGIDAETGVERFAYIPRMLLPKLNQLTLPAFDRQPLVDGQITVAEARTGSTWKTVLASGLGGGAQGVFALDVSSPDNFATGGGVLFEFTDNDDADMGNLMGAPVIAKFRSAFANGMAQYKYFVVVPSGLNNYRNDAPAGKFNAAAPSVVFLLSLDKQANEAWSLGVNYYKITLPNPTSELQSGLSQPALAVGPDGAVLYGYVGDLRGNLWRLDFTGLPPWSNALGSDPKKPLFTATDTDRADGARVQPITMQPRVVFAPGGGYIVLFGTGKFLEQADMLPGNFSLQSFYGIYDSTGDGYRVASRAELEQRTLTSNPGSGGYAIAGKDFLFAASPALDSLTKKGWYVDFPGSRTSGERAVTSPLVINGQVYFNTIAPGSDPCGAGSGRAYALDAVSGTNNAGVTGYLSPVGMLSAPVLFQMGTATLSPRNAVGSRTAGKDLRVLHIGAGSTAGSIQQGASAVAGGASKVDVPAGRSSWREIVNWQELRAAAKSQ